MVLVRTAGYRQPAPLYPRPRQRCARTCRRARARGLSRGLVDHLAARLGNAGAPLLVSTRAAGLYSSDTCAGTTPTAPTEAAKHLLEVALVDEALDAALADLSLLNQGAHDGLDAGAVELGVAGHYPPGMLLVVQVPCALHLRARGAQGALPQLDGPLAVGRIVQPAVSEHQRAQDALHRLAVLLAPAPADSVGGELILEICGIGEDAEALVLGAEVRRLAEDGGIDHAVGQRRVAVGRPAQREQVVVALAQAVGLQQELEHHRAAAPQVGDGELLPPELGEARDLRPRRNSIGRVVDVAADAHHITALVGRPGHRVHRRLGQVHRAAEQCLDGARIRLDDGPV